MYPTPWEYLVVAEEDAGDLNALGDQGWDLAGVSNGWLYFKRPAPSFRERVTLDQKRDVYRSKRIPLPSEEESKA